MGASGVAEVEGPPGRYRLSAAVTDGALVVVRELTVSTTTLPAESYDDVRAFFDAVASADGAMAVLKRE